MKKLLVILYCIFFSCKDQDGKTVLTPQEFKEKITTVEGLQLVDVRTLTEVENGKIENAMHIDFYEPDFKQNLESKLDKSKPVAVYCKKGGRSGKAAKMLKELGFKEIYDLKGGYDSWVKN